MWDFSSLVVGKVVTPYPLGIAGVFTPKARNQIHRFRRFAAESPKREALSTAPEDILITPRAAPCLCHGAGLG